MRSRAESTGKTQATIVHWVATAGLEEAGTWMGRNLAGVVGVGGGWKEVKPGELFFQGAELGGAESRQSSPQGWEGQVRF